LSKTAVAYLVPGYKVVTVQRFRNALYWMEVDCNGVQRIRCGSSRTATDPYGRENAVKRRLRVVADSNGLSWIAADCHELQRIAKNRLRQMYMRHVACSAPHRHVRLSAVDLDRINGSYARELAGNSRLRDLIMNHYTLSLRFFNQYTSLLYKFRV
jgi:hypothetical protein